MIVPIRLSLLLALLLGAAARADTAPSRTKRERPVTVTGKPAEPLPEVHVATDAPTVLLFPADINKISARCYLVGRATEPASTGSRRIRGRFLMY